MAKEKAPTTQEYLSLSLLCVAVFSGHAILCRQGKWGRGAVPLTYVSLGSVSSVGGKGEAKNI